MALQTTRSLHMVPGFLDDKTYATVIQSAPVLCVDVDVVVPDRSGDRHLLFHRCNEPLRGTWWVPGGRVHKGEKPVAAAVRKLAEEAGLTFATGDLRLVGFYDEVFEFSSIGRGPYHAVSLVFRTWVDADKLYDTIRLDHQHDDWMLADELPRGFLDRLTTAEGK